MSRRARRSGQRDAEHLLIPSYSGLAHNPFVERKPLEDLDTLNRIADTLNRAVDIQAVLDTTLAQLVDLMGLKSGWIFLRDSLAGGGAEPGDFVLAAHYRLPPALDPDRLEAWAGGCECQERCTMGSLTQGYNEIHCSRLAHARGDRRGLTVHASAPLQSGDQILGILNVTGPDWDSFSPQALALLTNVSSQIGVALERARLYDLLREQRIHEQAILLDLSNQLLGRRDMDDLMTFLVEETRRLLRADGCALLLPGSEAGDLRFRAACGWNHSPVEAGHRVPDQEHTSPGQVMQTLQPILMEDVGAYEPPAWNPDWLRAEGFRGHAVVPLVAEGRAIGVLMLNTRQPRPPVEDDVRFLRLIANQAAIAIEKARLHQEEAQRRLLENELALARQIQLSLLPRTCPYVPGWDCAALYEAARIVAGDFYDVFELPGKAGRIGLVIADVVGKGISAALFMALSRTMIRTAALSNRSPAEALAHANRLIRNDSDSDLFVTAFYAIVDTNTGAVTYANAGHNRPLWLQAGTGQIEELAAEGIVLGIFDQVELEERQIQTALGDILLLFTDGITEAMDQDRQQFGSDRLGAVLASQPDATADGVIEAAVGAVQAFTGSNLYSDDLTLLVLKRQDPGA
jgi:sigma-B regulation protein RsbU (phosphoserine phosphatase)